jgi:hypothetical protein
MDMIGYTEPGYEELSHILFEALNQAQSGKGIERHANKQPFIYQLGLGFTAGQARKKILEAVRCADITPDRSIGDLLDAIIYTAATILSIRSQTRLIPHPPYLDFQPDKNYSSEDKKMQHGKRGSSAAD